jgi:ubiquinone/menaquinone biosynthesis C-methylase UbiE
LLNVGCKSSYTDDSDINLDIVSRDVPRFILGDIQKLNMFRNKQFGAVYASHVLEHVEDPDAALKELNRVADKVFVITPLPILPWAWLHPDHKWIMWGTMKLCKLPQNGRSTTSE